MEQGAVKMGIALKCLVKGENCFLVPPQFVEGKSLVVIGVRVVGLHLQRVVVGVDGFVVVAQVKERPAFLVPGMEVMGVLCNGPVKILESLAKPAKVIQ